VVSVATESGSVVLASDAMHYYEEVERDRPFAIVADLEGMYRSFDALREMRSQPGCVLVAGHDPAVMTRFPTVVGQDGLAVRLA
jgi:glyoxylase-like metal-dependent hydrolase (beta-lactamase superfamily II)